MSADKDLRASLTLRLSYGQGDRACAIPVAPGLRAGISLAAAGDMALSRRELLPHRARFISSLGIPLHRAYGLRQVHSRRVILLEGQSPEEIAAMEADGMVTMRNDVLLTVTVADCLPIFISDSVTGAFGLVHSGWKGTGIVVAAIELMSRTFGTRVGDLRVTIGPGIGPCCYRVPEDRAEGFAAEFGSVSVARPPGEQPRLDLRAANTMLLEKAGVAQITVSGDCTCCSPALSSFRRQGPRDFTLMLAHVGAKRKG